MRGNFARILTSEHSTGFVAHSGRVLDALRSVSGQVLAVEPVPSWSNHLTTSAVSVLMVSGPHWFETWGEGEEQPMQRDAEGGAGDHTDRPCGKSVY